MINRQQASLVFALAGALVLTACAPARPMPPPERHPAYERAVSDLRAARWDLEHRPGDPVVSGNEDIAITEIDRAINEARRAAFDDGRNPNARPPVDTRPRPGRLHDADSLLRRAHDDVARAEDNPGTRGLRDAVLMHIDAAIRATDQAIREVEMRR